MAPNETAPSLSINTMAPPAANGSAKSPTAKSTAGTYVPKTDKPRPHVCGTCARSFARLEHLKRHERSHTKEKPFECPDCARCFARRDLLLRHQQKLHLTATPSSRPRSGRRESTSGMNPSASRVRKNSISTSAQQPAMRPRANTIAHVDAGTLSMIAAANASHHRRENEMPKLSLNSLNGLDIVGALQGAATMLPQDIELDNLLAHGFGNLHHQTVNPAVLHMNPAMLQQQMNSPISPFGDSFSGRMGKLYVEDEDDFGWMNNVLNDDMTGHEVAVESPSAISTTSASGISEVMLDASLWPSASAMSSATTMSSNNYSDYQASPTFHGASPSASPKFQTNPRMNEFFTTASPLANLSPTAMQNQHPFMQLQQLNTNQFSPEAPIHPQQSTNSVTTIQSDTITDATRQALLSTLLQPSSFGGNQYQSQHRRYSLGSALSPPQLPLPGTKDLQRYVASYIRYFHPHLPFLHLPTLNFDSPVYTNAYRSSSKTPAGGISGGGGCLILSMAAIGALYEYDAIVAREIHELAKKAIHIFLDDRRKAACVAGINGTSSALEGSNNTPVWLVQAMLLNVAFGANSGDFVASEVAVQHCAAVVALANSAGLQHAQHADSSTQAQPDTHMHDNGNDLGGGEAWGMGFHLDGVDEHTEWTNWAAAEERKRTMFAVHMMSSLLVAAYNFAPTMPNSELKLDLPCDEELWSASSAQVWKLRGGATSIPGTYFPSALASLLHGQNQPRPSFLQSDPLANEEILPPNKLKPSTWGCLVLICAIHVYIWETRQLRHTRQWTASDAEAMQAHIEPALKAWEVAWISHPHASVHPMNPYGPISADCIPLLDLAYMRLYVDIGSTKESFWSRNFEGLADDVANLEREWDNPQNNISSSGSSSGVSDISSQAVSAASTPASEHSSPHPADKAAAPAQNAMQAAGVKVSMVSPREKRLRKAASYAVDAFSMNDKLGMAFTADTCARELPLQSALCSFDCAQVLAEWLATLQDRIGTYLGVLGAEGCDVLSYDGLMLLEDEDRVLLSRVMEVLRSAEEQMAREWGGIVGIGGGSEGGLGTKVLRVTAFILDKTVVWPVLRLGAQALRIQAERMEVRTKTSIMAQ